MSKFIQHPFDFQIRSAIRREACAIRKTCELDAVASLIARINYILEGGQGSDDSLHLIAYPDPVHEGGSNPIDVTIAIAQAYAAQGTGGYNSGITAEEDVQVGEPLGFMVSLVAYPDIITMDGSFPIEFGEETLMAFSAQGSGGYNSGITAEPEVTMV